MDVARLHKFLEKMVGIKSSTGGFLAVECIAGTAPYDWDTTEGDNTDGSRMVLLPIRVPVKIVKQAELLAAKSGENIDNVLRDMVAVIGHTGLLKLAMDHIIEETVNDESTDKH